MVFTIDNKLFSLNFIYDEIKPISDTAKKLDVNQRVVIARIGYGEDSKGKDFVTGMAICSPLDTFNRIKGRKIALKKLFRDYKNSKSYWDNFDWIADKASRATFWSQYKNKLNYIT